VTEGKAGAGDPDWWSDSSPAPVARMQRLGRSHGSTSAGRRLPARALSFGECWKVSGSEQSGERLGDSGDFPTDSTRNRMNPDGLPRWAAGVSRLVRGSTKASTRKIELLNSPGRRARGHPGRAPERSERREPQPASSTAVGRRIKTPWRKNQGSCLAVAAHCACSPALPDIHGD